MTVAIGWFADDGTIEHDPGVDVQCPHCGRALREMPRRTISIGYGGRSVFYRVHAACADRASPDEVADIESPIVDGVH